MRMAGYIIGALVNSAFIWLLNVSPGWRWVPFLSDDFAGVVGVMTLSFALGVVANLVYVALDPPWLRRLGDAVTAAAGLAVLLQLVRIFPFIAPFPWPGWETPFRVLLVLACVGAGIGVIANVGLLARDLSSSSSRESGGGH